MNTEIQIPVAALKVVLPGLAKVLPRHTALPVLQCVKIALDAEGKAIQLQAHGLDEVATVRLENKAAGTPGQLLVPFEMLSKIIKGCASDQSIGFIGSKGQTTLRYSVGMSSVDRVVSYLSPEEWPEVKAIGQEPIPLTEPFKAALKEALECASEDSSRYVLNGACLDVSDKAGHYVVGTDGRHLYSANSFQFSLPESFILPTRKFPTWSGFVNDGPWKLRMAPAIRVDPQQKEKTEQDQPAWFQIESDRWTYLARAIEGKFPNWRQCVPTFGQDWTRVELQPAAIKVILEAVPLLPGADSTNEPIRLEVGERLTLRARGNDQSDDTRVPIAEVKVSGNPVEVSLNRGYLLKALRFGLNQVDIREPLDPVRFSSAGRSMVVMPLRMEPDPVKAPTTETQAQAAPEPTPSTETTPAAPPSAPEAVTPTEPERNTVTENTMPQRGNLKSHPSANGNGEESRSGFKAVLEQLDQVKTSLRQVLSDLNEATSALKAAEKEQRASTREIEAVRAKLREIQSVAI